MQIDHVGERLRCDVGPGRAQYRQQVPRVKRCWHRAKTVPAPGLLALSLPR